MTVIHEPLGADILCTHTTPQFKLGTRAYGESNSEFLYVKAGSGGITGAGYVVAIDEAFTADMLSTSNDARGDLVGVAPMAFTAAYYGWVQRSGPASVRVAASAAANVRLNSTATAGQIDDDGTAGSMQVDGIVLTTANGASAGTAAGQLNYPAVGVTI